MAKVEHTSDARVLVGIDISKHRHEVLIAVPGKTRHRRLTITNSTDDFMRLIAILREYGLPVRIGFEATGNYHRVLMYHLGVAGFDLKLVSSVALARTREALHNSWDKNDPKDAQVILHMLQIGAVQIFQDPMVAGTSDIQELSKTHDAVSRAKTELWHRILTHYLPLYFPEADRFHRSSRTDWFLAFLEMFPSPQMISALTKEEFIQAAWGVVGRKVEKSLMLSDIYETAKTSAGLPVSPDSDAIRMFRLPAQPYCAQRGGLEYRARRKHCGRRQKLALGGWLHDFVRGKLIHRRWSPEQIARKLRAMHPEDPTRQISHETIYAAIYAQPRGGLKAEMLAALRQAKPARGLRRTTLSGGSIAPESLRIIHRPEEIEGRLVPGHWPYGDASIAYRLIGRRSDQGGVQPLGSGHGGRAQDPLSHSQQDARLHR